MDRIKLKTAIEEAERFLKRAKSLPKPVTRMYCDGSGRTYQDGNFPKEQGAIRRASMDLTRALADLRRSPS